MYPHTTVQEFVDFCQKITRFSESSVYGFLPHLNSREAAALLIQTITTEARQQMIFRQFEGLFPMPIWFEVAVPQSWAWTLLAPHISSCPANQTRLAWQNFPALWILNHPNPTQINGSMVAFNKTLGPGMNTLNNSKLLGSPCLNSSIPGLSCNPAITHNRSVPLSRPGRHVVLQWEVPGQRVGPNNSYVTSTLAKSPRYVLWASQLNVTYTRLMKTDRNVGATVQPGLQTYQGDPAVNGTIFIAITDRNLYVTPFNISLVNPHIVAGPALYQAG